MKKCLVPAALLAASLSASAAPEIDCAVFPPQATSLYILPYEVGTAWDIYATTEHYRGANQGVGSYAIDFVMPIGTKVLASRNGEVVSIQASFKDGNSEDLKENYVFIKHSDGTVARYFHLRYDGVLVQQGDQVVAGEVIGLSGNTGQSGGPHLHFDVQRCGPNLPPHYNRLPCGQTVPLTFKNTTEHSCGLTTGKKYTALQFNE
ncbi:M23 family metallopeptidase [Pseudoalteromonas xiamenensis]|uniref:M23 family metallopeptidase n=1 Tax=Pseudoalteromonas xiamenensis TaxID=882626 RepID=A0A975DM56_9GAMM|nr:M23 family metallopeptidase [Pseudoalteromonas xiamenensis]QTH73565.1 M23 family metallopeptidase [Pseudoalteromonas xiamenensis]